MPRFEPGPCRSYFNSRPREGANVRGRGEPLGAPHFNSRPREGANAPGGAAPTGGSDFNSRPREGANAMWRDCAGLDYISIPAPVRGRTGRPPKCCPPPYFNSRPREGANSKTVQNRAVYLVSLLKFGRISAIPPYILSATRAKKT